MKLKEHMRRKSKKEEDDKHFLGKVLCKNARELRN
jgi:hypothetical protein